MSRMYKELVLKRVGDKSGDDESNKGLGAYLWKDVELYFAHKLNEQIIEIESRDTHMCPEFEYDGVKLYITETVIAEACLCGEAPSEGRKRLLQGDDYVAVTDCEYHIIGIAGTVKDVKYAEKVIGIDNLRIIRVSNSESPNAHSNSASEVAKRILQSKTPDTSIPLGKQRYNKLISLTVSRAAIVRAFSQQHAIHPSFSAFRMCAEDFLNEMPEEEFQSIYSVLLREHCKNKVHGLILTYGVAVVPEGVLEGLELMQDAGPIEVADQLHLMMYKWSLKQCEDLVQEITNRI